MYSQNLIKRQKTQVCYKMDCVNYFRMVIPKTRQAKSINNLSTFKVSLTKTTSHVISIVLHVKGDLLPEKKNVQTVNPNPICQTWIL